MEWNEFPPGIRPTGVEALLVQKAVRSVIIIVDKYSREVRVDVRLGIIDKDGHEILHLAKGDLQRYTSAYGLRYPRVFPHVQILLREAVIEYKRLCNVKTCPHCKEVIEDDLVKEKMHRALKAAYDVVRRTPAHRVLHMVEDALKRADIEKGKQP